MNCIALDDEPLALRLLEDYITSYPGLVNQGCFTNPHSANERLKAGGIDLLFLDIEMPDMSGIAFLKQLKNPPMVIFTTAHPGFAVEGFNLSAIDYLLKPFDFERFVKAVDRAAQWRALPQNPAPAEYIQIKSGYAVFQIDMAKIMLLEGFDDYVKIHLEDQAKPLLTISSLKAILDKLPADQFLRIHRSYAVAVERVVAVRRNKIRLSGDFEVPVGETYLAGVRGRLFEFNMRHPKF